MFPLVFLVRVTLGLLFFLFFLAKVMHVWNGNQAQGQPQAFHGAEPADKDYYQFYLNPKPGVEEVKLNMVLECEETTVPVLYLSQTVYDPEGYPTGYVNIGTYYGTHGELLLLDVTIPYDFLEKNDVYMRLDGIYPKDYVVKDYEFKYWNY